MEVAARSIFALWTVCTGIPSCSKHNLAKQPWYERGRRNALLRQAARAKCCTAQTRTATCRLRITRMGRGEDGIRRGGIVDVHSRLDPQRQVAYGSGGRWPLPRNEGVAEQERISMERHQLQWDGSPPEVTGR
jgi:hypothetical protein